MGDAEMAGYRVATERLGWPMRRRWSLPVKLAWPGESQMRLRYDDAPDEPTATCHLQPSPHEVALCHYPMEGLVEIPGRPSWTDLHPMLRCDSCAEQAGITTEDPTGRVYRHDWNGRAGSDR